MSTTKKTKNPMQLNGVKLRISQGAVAKKAIHNIELLFRKMSLDPKAVKGSKRRLERLVPDLSRGSQWGDMICNTVEWQCQK